MGVYFLEINDLDYCVSKFIIEMENIAVYIADNKIDKNLESDKRKGEYNILPISFSSSFHNKDVLVYRPSK